MKERQQWKNPLNEMPQDNQPIVVFVERTNSMRKDDRLFLISRYNPVNNTWIHTGTLKVLAWMPLIMPDIE